MERIPYHSREVVHFSQSGEVYSFAEVANPPSGFEDFAPYVLAIIKTDDGVTLTAQLTDVDASTVYIGMRVEMVTRILKKNGDTGLIEYGFKFRPAIYSQI